METLLGLTDELVRKHGAFLMFEDLIHFVDFFDNKSSITADDADQKIYSGPQSRKILRLLTEGCVDELKLPSQLQAIAKKLVQAWRVSELLEEETEKATDLDCCHPNKTMTSKFHYLGILIQYSELSIKLSRDLGGKPEDGQLTWPLGCQSVSTNGYPWPPVIFSSPFWDADLLGWQEEADNRHGHHGLFSFGAFVPPRWFEENFDPDKNVGVLTWFKDEEDFFANVGAEDLELFTHHRMSVNWGSLFWSPRRVLENHGAPISILARRLLESEKASWLGPATMDSSSNRKHTLCFWDQKDDKEPKRKLSAESRSELEAMLADFSNVLVDEERYILMCIGTILKRMHTPPPRQKLEFSAFIGDWTLETVLDTDGETIPLLERPVKFHLTPVKNSVNQVAVNTDIINRIWGTMIFLNDPSSDAEYPIRFTDGPMQTMTGCRDQRIRHLEKMVCKILRSIIKIETTCPNASSMQLSGSHGKIVLAKMDENSDKM